MADLQSIIREHSAHLDPLPTAIAVNLSPLIGIRALLFDIYGTLLISRVGDISLSKFDQCQHILPWAFEKMGLKPMVPAKKIAKAFLATIKSHHEKQRIQNVQHPEVEIRAVWEDLLQTISGNKPSPKDTETLAVLYESRANPVWPMPGLQEIPDLLKQKNLVGGIISNAQFYTPLLFEALLGKTPAKLGFAPEFSAWSYEQLEAKPSKRLYEICARTLQKQAGIAPHEVLYLGNDMRNDILPAHKTGFRTALFAGDARSLRLREDDADCRELEPDLVLTELGQLADCLTES